MRPMVNALRRAWIRTAPRALFPAFRLLALTGLIGLALAGPLASPVQATGTVTVSKTADTDDGTCDADCSLREAVAHHNATGGTTVINVPPGTYELTLGALPAILDNSTLTIQGTSANAADAIIRQTTSARILETTLGASATSLTLQNLTFEDGRGGNLGGGALLAGGVGDTTTITNCIFTGNNTTAGSGQRPGGAIEHAPAGNLTITGSTFTNNSATDDGGAVDFFAQTGNAGSLHISGSTFMENTAGGNGGAIYLSSPVNGSEVIRSHFIDNEATGGGGGAIAHAQGTVNVNYSRFSGNTATTAANGTTLLEGGSGMTAPDNWWGSNSGPTANDIAGMSDPATWLQLGLTSSAGSTPLVRSTGATTLTASILGRNSGGAIAGSNLTGLNVAIGFGSPVLGTLSNAGTQLVEGTATATFTADAIGGNGSAAATVDGQTVTVSIPVELPPSITSGNAATFTVGTAGTFTVTATGIPTPVITKSGTLPSSVTFTDNGDGTATLAGTPATGSGGTYVLTITAANGVTPEPDATQSFTLTVNEAPSIGSSAATTFTTGAAGTFTVTTGGYPKPALSKTGALPSGVTFTDNGNGTATLAGTPAAGTGGTYPLTITAGNGVGTDASQSFTLTVNQAPAVTSPAAVTFLEGVSKTFTVTTTGFPVPTLSKTGALPSGVTFTDNGNGTATLVGTAAAASAGAYNLTITAANGVGTAAEQSFTLTVNPVPTTLTVNSTADAVDASIGDGVCATAGSVCTLRAAIQEANALPGAQTITFAASTNGTPITLTITGSGEDAAATGDLDITDTDGALTIAGNGPTNTVVQAANCNPVVSLSCIPVDRVFHIHTDATLTATALAVRHGSGGTGGGIFNEGTLTLSASTVTMNKAGTGGGGGIATTGSATVTGSAINYNAENGSSEFCMGGGGILYRGPITVDSSTIAGNTACLGGGVGGVGTATIQNTTIMENSAFLESGGGVKNAAGALTLIGVTVAGNTAVGNGGGIANNSELHMTNSTVRNNNAGGRGGGLGSSPGGATIAGSIFNGNQAGTDGGGIFLMNGLIGSIANTTVSNNTSVNGAGISFGGGNPTPVTNSTITGNTAASGGSSVYAVGGILTLTNTIVANSSGGDCSGSITSGGHNLSSDASCGFSNAGDLENTDPLLGPLANNGGPTQTHLPLPGSPAINAGDNAVCAAAPVNGVDQRGTARPVGPVCDIGSVEAPPNGYFAAMSTAGVPSAWELGETKLITVSATNVGTETWNATGGNPVALLVQFRPSAGQSPITQQVFPLAGDVAVSDPVTFTNIAVTAPNTSAAVLELAMLRQGFPLMPTPAQVAVTVGTPGGSIETNGVPTVWVQGKTQTFTVGVENTGATTWLAAGSTRVILRARFAGQPDRFFALPANVPGGDSANVSVTLTAPAAPGNTNVELALIKQGANAVFGAVSVPVSVRVAFAGTIDMSDVPPSWVAGRPSTFSVDIQNTGGAAWATSGGDRVVIRAKIGSGSYQYVGFASAVEPDSAAPATNISLSAPGTAGTFPVEIALWRPATSTAFAIETVNVTVGGPLQGTLTAPSPEPVEFTAGRTRNLTIPVQNTAGASGNTWTTAGSGRVLVRAKLGSQSFVYGGLAANVAPGASGSATVAITAPATLGDTNLELALVLAGNATPFFTTNVDAAVISGLRGNIATGSVPSAWAPNREQTFSVTIENSALAEGNEWGAGAGQPNRVLLRTRFVQRDAGQNVTASSSFIYTDLEAAAGNETPNRVKPGRSPLESATAPVTMQAPAAIGAWEMELALVPAGTSNAFSTVYAAVGVESPVQGTITTSGIPADWTKGRSPVGATVSVTNTAAVGGLTWTNAGSGRVLVRVQVDGQPFQYFDLPGNVAPGSSATVNLVGLTAAPTTGSKTVNVALATAGSTETFATASKSTAVKEARVGTLSTNAVPDLFTTGRPRTFTVGVTNTAAPDGDTWQTSGAGRIVVRARFDGASPTPYVYTDLPNTIAPGASANVDVTLIAPAGAAEDVPVELALAVAGAGTEIGTASKTVDLVPALRGTLNTGAVPGIWTRGQPKTFTVALENTAAPDGQTWPASGGSRVLVRARFAGTPATSFVFAALAGDVAPGASGSASVTLIAPTATGTNSVELALVVAGQPPFEIAAPVSVSVREARQASISAVGLPATWSPGQTQTFSVTATNTGAETWNATGSNPVNMVAKMVDTTTGNTLGTVKLVNLASDVALDGTATLEVTLTAPANLTDVAVHLQMNKSGVGVIPAALQQDVTPAAA